MTQKRVIKKVARTGGVIFEGDEDWYNPVGKVKEFLLNAKGMEGKEVEVTFTEDDPHKFTYLKVVGSAPSEGKVEPSANNQRSFALSYAKDIRVALIEKGGSNDIHATLIQAEKFNKYLVNGHIDEP